MEALSGNVMQIMLAKLREMLKPLGKTRVEKIAAWIEREAKTRPIIDYVAERKEAADEYELVEYKLFNESPVHPSMIFAMLYWERERVVCIYSFREVEFEGKTGAEFFRTVVCNPARLQGPLSELALFEDFETFMGVDDEPKPTPNGAPEEEEEEEEEEARQ